MTKSSRRKSRYCVDCGKRCSGERCGACIEAARKRLGGKVDHLLDQMTEDDLGKDEVGKPREGLAGVHDIRMEAGYQRLEEELNWYIAHADSVEPPQLSPMNQPLDVDQVLRLARLTRPQHEAMALKLEGHTLDEIAELLDVDPVTNRKITPGAVQQRLNWARLKLKVLAGDLLFASLLT